MMWTCFILTMNIVFLRFERLSHFLTAESSDLAANASRLEGVVVQRETGLLLHSFQSSLWSLRLRLPAELLGCWKKKGQFEWIWRCSSSEKDDIW
jgi:hypothetical protein